MSERVAFLCSAGILDSRLLFGFFFSPMFEQYAKFCDLRVDSRGARRFSVRLFLDYFEKSTQQIIILRDAL